MFKTVLAITLGDPGGIGPEVALKAAYQRWPGHLQLVLVGSRSLLARQARALRLPLPPPADLSLATKGRGQSVMLWEPPPKAASAQWRPGSTGRQEGQAAAHWITAAVRGCQQGLFEGMVTAPICKKSLQLAGWNHPGHTELLAELTGTQRYAMLLMGGPLRVALVTRHIPLASVPKHISSQIIVTTAELTAQALSWLQVKNRLIGMCALNPHAGDQGLLGREEITQLQPAVRTLRRRGIPVAGPIPADIIFHQARQGRYGAILAMYHDQGLGPLKMIAFERGVNLTLGLPILRVSPDHGTAFDIAGRGQADPRSMIATIRLAARLARRPNPWSGIARS